MNQVLEKVFSTRLVFDAKGNEFPLHSATSSQQCKRLQQVIEEIKPKISLEIGLAYGISTLAICEKLKQVNADRHIVIDPFQDTQWKGIGINNLREAGYESLIDFRDQFSHEALPQLLKEKVKIDFAYVDTTKLFDVVLVDLYYLQMLLNIGGIVVIDDCRGRGIRKVCRFLAKHPSWEPCLIIGETPDNPKEVLLSRIIRYIPKSQRIFANNLIDRDVNLGINGHCVGFRKVREDDRHWSWFEEF